MCRRAFDLLRRVVATAAPLGWFAESDANRHCTRQEAGRIKNQPGWDDPGHFILFDGALEAVTGTDLGLLWHTTSTPADFVLKLDWRTWKLGDNSGVFLRFPNPGSKNYDNNAFVGVDCGFEVQIDQLGQPDGAGIHQTGAIYSFAGPSSVPAKPLGEWNSYEITV